MVNDMGSIAERKMAAALTVEMIEEVKKRLQVGDMVIVLDKEDDGSVHKRRTGRLCPVVSKSCYTFNVLRQGGWQESFSYIELACGLGVRW